MRFQLVFILNFPKGHMLEYIWTIGANYICQWYPPQGKNQGIYAIRSNLNQLPLFNGSIEFIEGILLLLCGHKVRYFIIAAIDLKTSRWDTLVITTHWNCESVP